MFTSIAIAIALFVALLDIVLKYTENATYVLYLLCDTIWTWEFSRRERLNGTSASTASRSIWSRRPSTDAEEIVIVGHSSGSFLSTEMLARALKLDPALGVTDADRAADDRRQFPIVGYRRVDSSASICGCWRSSPRSTGSTARRART